VSVKATFNANRAGINAVARAPFMQREMLRRAEHVKDLAVQLSPVITGRYRANWTSRVVIRGGKAVGIVSNDTPYAWYVERGNSRGAPAQHVARRALAAARR
jgi:bacteriophage HK97-gp10 putative tail-component